ncbi:MAG: cohesin domain-containing protein [Candidatus Bathyarchaeota archaeon]|nr:cohesin domain-containing protein [Candidatus Bathyarchaeota archaeon]
MKSPVNLRSKQIVAILVCVLLSFGLFCTVLAQDTTVKAEASSSQPRLGETLTVNIKIVNVENLFGVDVTLSWNTFVLKVISAEAYLGVESYPEGVLHEVAGYPIEVLDNNASQSLGQYHLMATSTGSAPAFSGSGTIATVTFNVTDIGDSGLSLETELSDKPASDGHSNLINHTATVDSVTAVVPEFSTIAVLALMALATVAIIVSTKKLKTRQSCNETIQLVKQ